MTKIAATFSNGQTVNRNSDRAYAFAWAVIRIADGKITSKGFSADRANAGKAAQSHVWSAPSTRDRKNPLVRRYWAKLAKDQGFATVDALIAHWDAEAAAYNAAHRIEIVAVA